MRGVANDKSITIFQRFVLLRLCLYRNARSGRCDPSYQTIADEIGADRRSIIRAIEAGVARGWLARPVGEGQTATHSPSVFRPIGTPKM
jgi:hypothetical protein